MNAAGGGVVWFTGLSASGKTTLARATAEALSTRGIRSTILDGDEVRRFFDSDLGFSAEDRARNTRRIGFGAALLAREGLLVLVAAIAPYAEVRAWLRRKIPRLLLVYLDVGVEACRVRDRKGVYGGRTPVVGVDDRYDPPHDADLVLHDPFQPAEGAERVSDLIFEKGWGRP